MLNELSKFTKLKELKWLGLGIILGGLVAGFSVKGYYAGQSFQEVAINEAKPVDSKMCDEDGSFTTTSGFRYCFIFKDTNVTFDQMRTECDAYGRLAQLGDGETKQDILDIIATFLPLRSELPGGFKGNGGPVILDDCDLLSQKFDITDEDLFAENGNRGGLNNYNGNKCDSTAPLLIFDKELQHIDKNNNYNKLYQNGRLSDTNGNGDIFGALCQMKKTPASKTPTCSQAAFTDNFNDNNNKINDINENHWSIYNPDTKKISVEEKGEKAVVTIQAGVSDPKKNGGALYVRDQISGNFVITGTLKHESGTGKWSKENLGFNKGDWGAWHTMGLKKVDSGYELSAEKNGTADVLKTINTNTVIVKLERIGKKVNYYYKNGTKFELLRSEATNNYTGVASIGFNVHTSEPDFPAITASMDNFSLGCVDKGLPSPSPIPAYSPRPNL